MELPGERSGKGESEMTFNLSKGDQSWTLAADTSKGRDGADQERWTTQRGTETPGNWREVCRLKDCDPWPGRDKNTDVTSCLQSKGGSEIIYSSRQTMEKADCP